MRARLCFVGRLGFPSLSIPIVFSELDFGASLVAPNTQLVNRPYHNTHLPVYCLKPAPRLRSLCRFTCSQAVKTHPQMGRPETLRPYAPSQSDELLAHYFSSTFKVGVDHRHLHSRLILHAKGLSYALKILLEIHGYQCHLWMAFPLSPPLKKGREGGSGHLSERSNTPPCLNPPLKSQHRDLGYEY